jgi:dTDP-4-dehydrorhamnose 3,5-epimerase
MREHESGIMKLIETALPGCFEIRPVLHKDARGAFVKHFQETLFRKLGLETGFKEEFYSHSRKGVLRGLHFQTAPFAQEKAVYCLQGKVMDVIVDLRPESSTYGRHAVVELDAELANGVYIPRGMAHGFLTLSEQATLLYKVSEEYAPAHDTGILWSSCGISWPLADPILSDRDRAFPTLADYVANSKDGVRAP